MRRRHGRFQQRDVTEGDYMAALASVRCAQGIARPFCPLRSTLTPDTAAKALASRFNRAPPVAAPSVKRNHERKTKYVRSKRCSIVRLLTRRVPRRPTPCLGSIHVNRKRWCADQSQTRPHFLRRKLGPEHSGVSPTQRAVHEHFVFLGLELRVFALKQF